MTQILTLAADASWTLAVLVGLPVLLLVIAALIYGGFWLIRLNDRVSEYERGLPKAFGIAALVAAVVFAGLTVVGFYPYSAEYHQWRETSGAVKQIDKRLIGTGSGMEDKFVVRFEGSGQQYGCDDTRCAGVEVGDSLTLSCKRTWQYTGTDGYDCRFVATEAAR